MYVFSEIPPFMDNSQVPNSMSQYLIYMFYREKELHMNIQVHNPSKEIPFQFQLLLHTYFRCPDVRKIQITGLHGCTFIDKTREPPQSYQVSKKQD